MKYLSSSFLVLTTLIASYILLTSESTGAPGNYTGAPGSSGTCDHCHASAPLNEGTGIELAGIADSVLQTNKEYELTVTITNPTSSNGFQVSVLDGDDNMAGTFDAGNGNQVQTIGGLDLVTHSSPNSTGEWTFKWTTGSSVPDEVTFHVIGNATAGNGTGSGDELYKDTYTYYGDVEASVPELSAKEIQLYPNPAGEAIMLENAEKGSRYRLVNTSGKHLKDVRIESNTNRIELDGLSRGVYLLVPQDRGSEVLRFMKK